MYKKTYLVFTAILAAFLLFGGTAAADDSYGMYSEVDTTVLEQFIEIINAEMADPRYENYIPAAKENLENKLAAAESLLTKNQTFPGTVTQTEIDRATNSLLDALSCLFEKGDKTALIELINECETTLEENKFTPDSWAAYQKVLRDAKYVRDDENAMQPDVDDAYEKLSDSRSNLRSSADKTALIKLIEECQIIANGENIYTPESWETFLHDLSSAISVREDREATQSEVDDAHDRLKNSLDGLTARWVPPDKTALIELVNECETTYTDENKYTSDSWGPYQDALANAHTVIDNFVATQDEVDNAYTMLDNGRPEPKQDTGGNKNTGKGSGTGQATITNPANPSGSVQNETPGTSYTNPLEEQPDEEQSPKGTFLFPWLILLVLIIAGVIYYRNYINSKEE